MLNGANLNLLGRREKELYGEDTLDAINRKLVEKGKQAGIALDFLQSNHEGVLIDEVQMAPSKGYCAIILNAGAFTHYSYALRDAISAIDIPVIEVHMTNIYQREDFRHLSVIAPVVFGQITGFGADSYLLALEMVILYMGRFTNDCNTPEKP